MVVSVIYRRILLLVCVCAILGNVLSSNGVNFDDMELLECLCLIGSIVTGFILYYTTLYVCVPMEYT